MDNLVRAQQLGDPEDQIPVLTPFETFPIAADALDEVSSQHAQVREVVLPQEKDRIEIGLEIRVGTAGRILPDVVFVAVEEAGIGTISESECGNGQRAIKVVCSRLAGGKRRPSPPLQLR